MQKKLVFKKRQAQITDEMHNYVKSFLGFFCNLKKKNVVNLFLQEVLRTKHHYISLL